MLIDTFREAVLDHGDRLAVVDGKGRATTYAELFGRAQELAVRWSVAGMGTGDRALVAMPLGADLYAALAALWQLRAAAVLSEPAMGLAGLRHAARSAAPKAYLSKGLGFWLLRHLIPDLRVPPLHLRANSDRDVCTNLPAGGAPGDAALVSFTSGSTGEPKVIVRSQGFLAAQDAALAGLLSHGADDEGADLVAFPVFVLANLGRGRTSVLPPWDLRRHASLDPLRTAAFCARHGVTRILAPPAALEAMLRAKAPDGLRTVITGGGPVYPDLVARIRAWCPGVEVVSCYGSTEAEPIAHLSTSDRVPDGYGIYAGIPVPEARVRIVDGEIQVSGPHVVQGYLDPAHDASTKVREAGVTWHRTGDAGRLDRSGLWLLGRHGAAVAGVHPFVAEAEARTWPGVRAAALGAVAGRPVLAIVGVGDRAAEWQGWARALGDVTVRRVDSIPMDRRHGSKVDRMALDAKLASMGP